MPSSTANHPRTKAGAPAGFQRRWGMAAHHTFDIQKQENRPAWHVLPA
jgi:hypothetical protein